jgi:hypothetical protein
MENRSTSVAYERSAFVARAIIAAANNVHSCSVTASL